MIRTPDHGASSGVIKRRIHHYHNGKKEHRDRRFMLRERVHEL